MRTYDPLWDTIRAIADFNNDQIVTQDEFACGLVVLALRRPPSEGLAHGAMNVYHVLHAGEVSLNNAVREVVAELARTMMAKGAQGWDTLGGACAPGSPPGSPMAGSPHGSPMGSPFTAPMYCPNCNGEGMGGGCPRCHHFPDGSRIQL
jgi:hypothetical protein